MNSTFVQQAARPAVAPLDPRKHVNYTMGMVLGVDDFNQEFTYLAGRDQWLARELLGYGTLSGLQVSAEDESEGSRVFVEAGVALSPRGQLIRVPVKQCADFATWLASQKHQLDTLLHGSTRDPAQTHPLKLYVVLSYAERPTGNLPTSNLPADANRAGQATQVASRISDDFQLDISFTPPDQSEEIALQAFVAWLRQVRIADEETSPFNEYTSLADFANAIRAATNLSAAHSSPPATFMSSPPPTDLLIPTEQATTYWRTAFQLWTTELRPRWQAAQGANHIPHEERVLLATLTLHVSMSEQGQWRVVVPEQKEHAKQHPAVLVDESERPYLLSLRMLQEWMQGGRRETPPSDLVTNANSFDQPANPGEDDSYSRADHTHGTPTLRGDVVANDDGTVTVHGLHTVPVVGTAPKDGQVLTYNAHRNHWHPSNLPFISATSPEDGQVLTYHAEQQQWQASNLPPISATPPEDGQMLKYNAEQQQWQAVNDNSVQHPEGAGRYHIVAAGLVRCNGESDHPTYNNLVARAEPQGQGRPTGLVLLSFNGYREPRKKQHPYIVNAIPRTHERVKSVLVHFERFEGRGILLRITEGNGNNIHHEQLRQLELMVEISHYE